MAILKKKISEKKILIPENKEEILFNDLFKSLEKNFYGIGIDSNSGSSGCFLAWVERGEITESEESAGWYNLKCPPSFRQKGTSIKKLFLPLKIPPQEQNLLALDEVVRDYNDECILQSSPPTREYHQIRII
ncbi:hypothetical protein PsalMR5_01681 [Piscirickettsia salmonis]|nr:hypothetical protein PsalBI1_02458 [Piscirickettsia salmonis]QGP63817.1 hypothetical protein PsalMR5_01681 [Piscirickettsia salmonis]